MTDPWDETLLWYARAVATMRSKPDTDPTSWQFQANIHGSPDGPGSNPEWDNCPHGGWFFLPWHRAYVYCFEEIVRSVIKDQLNGPDDWALPYWNYTRVTDGNPDSPGSQECRRLPKSFRSQDWPDGSGNNPLYLAPPDGRSQGAADGRPVGWTEVDPREAMAAALFTGVQYFGSADTDSQLIHLNGQSGLLENRPHNLLHNYVGGVMGQMISPQDPIFWLHHANIDRLWAAWLADSSHTNPADTNWLGFGYAFRDAQGNPVRFTSQDLLSEQGLGYSYESLTDGTGAEAAARGATLLAAAANPPERPVATTGASGLGTEALAVRLTPEPGDPVAALAEAALPETEPRAILTIDGVRADNPPGTSYRVFVGAPEDSRGDLDPEGPYFIGHINFFGASGKDARHHGGTGLTFRFDITDHLSRLRAQGLWSGDAIPPVHMTPAPLGPPPPEAPEAAAPPLIHPESRPRFGSVSLTTT
ncbi:tyrosinase family protein [Streptomyces sp. NPDC052396]|uniref:tyrosinase family protein n=1 Tax=Streptomyces sp. NPDC052396 TaxID=3365689 RepID=UPI0037D8B44A